MLHYLGAFRATPENFEDGSFTLKMLNILSVHALPSGEWENATVTVHFGFFFFLRKTRAEKSRGYRDVIVFGNLRYQNVFRPHENAKSLLSNSSCLRSVLAKLRFRDGLVWTVSPTIEIKLRFQISPA